MTVYLVWKLVSDQYGTEKLVEIVADEQLAKTMVGTDGALRYEPQTVRGVPDSNHVEAICRKLDEWFARGDTAPQAGSLVFEDDFTFKEHVQAALAGAPVDITQDPFYRAGGGPAKRV